MDFPLLLQVLPYKRVSIGWWLLRLSDKILALVRLWVNLFQLRLTKKLKINLFCYYSGCRKVGYDSLGNSGLVRNLNSDMRA